MPLAEAAGRVAAEEGRSAVDLPPFDRSAMDGYAVRAADTGAGAAAAGRRDRRGRGARPRRSSRAPTLGITTGAPIPPGADAVLQSELAELADGSVRATRADPGAARTSACAARTSTRAT